MDMVKSMRDLSDHQLHTSKLMNVYYLFYLVNLENLNVLKQVSGDFNKTEL